MLWHQSDPRESSESSEYTAADLKICDLCGALNLAANRECFVCRWYGRFEQRPAVVSLAIDLAERQHGRLEPWLLTDRGVGRVPLRRRLVQSISNIWHSVFDWLAG